jgi:FkbH-like protein
MEIGERARLYCRFAAVELRSFPGGTLRIGARTSINFGTTISAGRRVDIGDGVSFGPYCIVSDSDAPDGSGGKPISIGDGAWLASRVTVLPGARIGAGSVITAGSVVEGEIPPGVVAGGIPARVLRPIGVAADGAQDPSRAGASRVDRPRHEVLSASDPSEKATADDRPIAHRGLLVSDFTIDELARCLETGDGSPRLAASAAPYGQVIPALLGAPPPDTDFAVVWTRPEAIAPAFGRLLEFEEVEEAELLADVDAFCEVLASGLSTYRFAFVPTWTVPPWRRGLGVIDARAHGITRALHAMNARLTERLAATPNVFVLNAQRWIDSAGKGAHSPKLWYLGKVPFHTAVFEQAALDVKAAISGLTGLARKLVVVDLDDTLWGGIVGDVGWEGLRLGGHDSVGEAFVDFQRALRRLKRRGIVLAIVSKNDEAVALDAIRKHGQMVLHEEDFVGHRINWNDKARNIADLVSSLNLGLQSTVFLDDSPFERARVREALPEVLVPEWPQDPLLYASALESLRCFDAPAVSAEDAARTGMYSAERRREELKAQVGSVEEWLRSLGLRVHVEPLRPENLARTAQLLNKTNQMNLTTRRLTEPELAAWAHGPGRWLWTVSVSDRVGDAGLTGIVSVEARGGTARIVDFVLSCRVMGRRVEETMAHLAVDTARRAGLSTVVAELVPTPKNNPCLAFWKASGFTEDGPSFTWDAGRVYPLPDVLALEMPS